MTKFVVKRIYDPVGDSDGYRVLVDRLWPRGISTERAHLSEWAKELAPSTELRQWFGHDPAKFVEFSKRYTREIEQNPEASSHIGEWKKHPIVTLLYGARDAANNEAVVLQNYLNN